MVRPRRGELWTIAGGGGRLTSKPRPALILQSDLFDAGDYVTVALVTSFAVDSPVRAQLPALEKVGLNQLSFVEVDKLTTIPHTSLSQRIGVVPPMIEVERAILVFLDIAR